MTCHILHNPVMTLPIYNCDGCNPAAVEGYCATVGSGHPAVTHDECFRTLSNNSKQCSFGLPLEQSHLVRHPPNPPASKFGAERSCGGGQVRAFSMFDSGSRWVKEFGKTPWPEASQQMQREFW